jgi:hypothetical protein
MASAGKSAAKHYGLKMRIHARGLRGMNIHQRRGFSRKVHRRRTQDQARIRPIGNLFFAVVTQPIPGEDLGTALNIAGIDRQHKDHHDPALLRLGGFSAPAFLTGAGCFG